jgi:hypothetical protein
MDFHQLGYWFFCLCLFLTPLLVRAPFVRRLLEESLSRVGGPEEDRGLGADEFDDFPDRWSTLIRRERLLADVQRLRRIVATDMTMSAVRQLGNRIAYNQLLLELRDTPDLPVPAPRVANVDWWDADPQPAPPQLGSSGGPWRPFGKVETLEIGWRS